MGGAYQDGGQAVPLAYCYCIERKLLVVFDRCSSLIRIWVGKARWSGNWDEGFGGVHIYEGVT